MKRIDLIKAFAPKIKKDISPEQVLRQYVPGFAVQPNGFALCIAHAEKTASMKITRDHVYCHGCHFLGDSVAVTQKLFGLTPFDAMSKLNTDFRLGYPLEGRITLREGLEIKDAARARLAEERKREAERAEQLHLLDLRLDLEDRLFVLEEVIKRTQPTDPESDAPWDPLFVWATWEITIVRYRLKYEYYEG